MDELPDYIVFQFKHIAEYYMYQLDIALRNGYLIKSNMLAERMDHYSSISE